MRVASFLAAVAWLLASMPQPGNAAELMLIFNSTPFRFELPQGYCPPTGATADLANKVAALAPQAVVGTIFFECRLGAGERPNHYGMIATFKDVPWKPLPRREELVASFQTGIADGSLRQAVTKSDPVGESARNISQKLQRSIKLNGSPQFVTTDANAAYLAGTASVQFEGGAPRPMVIVGAVTEVRGQAILYYLYSHDDSEQAVTSELDSVKSQIARFIADNGG